MKFEKFLKSVGTHGEVVALNESEKYLVCGTVGMLIPFGVDNLLGVEKTQDNASIVHTLSCAEFDDPLTLSEAVLLDPAGNAKAIYRVFETALGDRIGITNTEYGFLERKDLLGYCEVEVPATDEKEAFTLKFIVVYDHAQHVQGFITGSTNF